MRASVNIGDCKSPSSAPADCKSAGTGDYIITFTLPNGDEYYGEFTVSD